MLGRIATQAPDTFCQWVALQSSVPILGREIAMQTPIDTDELVQFLGEANVNTYANKSAAKATASRLGSVDYHFEKGDLIFHDTYFGVRDFIGCEVIYKDRTAVWGMNYYGVIDRDETDEKTLYGFLRDALMQKQGDLIPVRGPQSFQAGEWRYTNTLNGGIDVFTGSEEIHEAGQLVYRAYYHGGFVR
jgi:hypothetical protein